MRMLCGRCRSSDSARSAGAVQRNLWQAEARGPKEELPASTISATYRHWRWIKTSLQRAPIAVWREFIGETPLRMPRTAWPFGCRSSRKRVATCGPTASTCLAP